MTKITSKKIKGSKSKGRFGEAISEILVELVLTVIFFAIGFFIINLFGDAKFDEVDSDLAILIGIIAFFIIFAIVIIVIDKIIKKKSRKRENNKEKIMDFNKSIFENRQEKGSPLLAAHRGVCGANVPCNTLAAYKIAVDQGADMVEIDVAISKDGKYFVFHPGTEPIFLKCGRLLTEMTSEEIENLYILNQDEVPTSYKIPTLAEVLALLKDKVYINVDKFWTDIKGISEEIRKAGVEKQVIVKTYTDEKSLAEVKEYASDFMFVPMVWEKDDVTERLMADGVNVIGAEILFKTEQDEVISDEYIASMHEKGLLVWANAIIYDEKAVISAHHTDDISLTDSPEKGWGWLIDKNVDFIQTDWLLALRLYIESRKLGK